MDIVETVSDGLTRGFKITVGIAELNQRQDERLTDIGRNAQIPGFRPGKIPLKILKQRFGQAVLGEVLEATVQESAQKTLADRGLRPAGQPKIDAGEFKEDQDFEYEMTVEILPEIEPGDFSSLDLERLKTEPNDEHIDAALQQIADQRRESTAVSEARPAKKGDLVVLDYRGLIDGEKFDGGTGEGYELELGVDRFIPGFEDQIEGQIPGRTFDVTVRFPDGYATQDIAGKEAIFECNIKEIKVFSEVKIDDDFAVSLGLSDLAALRVQAAQQIEREFDQMSRSRLKRRLLDQLSESHDFEVPPSMLEAEFQAIWEQVEAVKERGELDGEDAEKTDTELKEEYNSIARRRVRLGLLLSEIGQRNNITVEPEEVNRAVMQLARQYPGQEQQVVESYRKNPQALQDLQAPLFEDKVVDFILEMADVRERVVTREELYAEDDTDPATAQKKPASKKSEKRKTAPAKTAPAKKTPAKSAARKSSGKSAGEATKSTGAKSTGAKKSTAAKKKKS